MRELPILLNTQMVRAVMDGRMTQIRRPVKPQPSWMGYGENVQKVAESKGIIGGWKGEGVTAERLAKRAPYAVGDRLYLQEKLIRWCEPIDLDYPYYAIDETPVTANRKYIDLYDGIRQSWCWKGNTRQSNHMPKWAARTWLKVTKVWAERINDITLDGCIAEGGPHRGPKDFTWFHILWDSIYPDSRERNDWCFCYEFEVEKRKNENGKVQ